MKNRIFSFIVTNIFSILSLVAAVILLAMEYIVCGPWWFVTGLCAFLVGLVIGKLLSNHYYNKTEHDDAGR